MAHTRETRSSTADAKMVKRTGASVLLLVALARGEDDTFDIMDRDGDGLVKTEEIQSAWAKPDVYGDAAALKGQAEATMNWADANGDDASVAATPPYLRTATPSKLPPAGGRHNNV